MNYLEFNLICNLIDHSITSSIRLLEADIVSDAKMCSIIKDFSETFFDQDKVFRNC